MPVNGRQASPPLTEESQVFEMSVDHEQASFFSQQSHVEPLHREQGVQASMPALPMNVPLPAVDIQPIIRMLRWGIITRVVEIAALIAVAVSYKYSDEVVVYGVYLWR